jgi:hypothetical protein
MYTGPDRADDGMDSILDVKEALTARSITASLDDLKSKGHRRVKVIRAEHIAAMVQEAVAKALGGSGMVSREEVDRLVDRSQHEFRQIIQEREQQLAHAREVMLQLEHAKADRVRLQASLQEVVEDRGRFRAQLEEAIEERDRLAQRLVELGDSGAGAAGTPHEHSAGNADLMLRLMNEVAELKASMTGRHAGGTAAGASGQSDALAAALSKLAGSIDDRLEKFGRKIGISSAVEAREVNFKGLFDKDGGKELESNMDQVQMKKKTEGSIHANLERLRKLKGDG